MRRQAARASQNWIFDNFIQLTDNEDILHPGIMGIRLERGFKYGDMERIFRAVTGRRAFPREGVIVPTSTNPNPNLNKGL